MASIHRSQFRLQQISGSLGIGANQINDQITAVAVATGSINSSDIGSILSHMAAGVKKIHGSTSFSEAAPGRFYHDIKLFDNIEAEFGDAADLKIKHNSTGNKDQILSAGAGGLEIDVAQGMELDVAAGLTIDSTTLSIDAIDNTNITVGGTGKTLDIDASGALTIDSATSIAIGAAQISNSRARTPTTTK